MSLHAEVGLAGVVGDDVVSQNAVPSAGAGLRAAGQALRYVHIGLFLELLTFNTVPLARSGAGRGAFFAAGLVVIPRLPISLGEDWTLSPYAALSFGPSFRILNRLAAKRETETEKHPIRGDPWGIYAASTVGLELELIKRFALYIEGGGHIYATGTGLAEYTVRLGVKLFWSPKKKANAKQNVR